MDEEKLLSALREHSLWLASNGNRGRRADLRNAKLSGLNFLSFDLSRSKLRHILTPRAFIKGHSFVPVSFCGADLRHAELVGSNLGAADLRAADLREADLTGVNLSRAILSGANLEGAKLHNADCAQANFVRANLRNTDLSLAFLLEADLEGANLEGANINGARFERANLAGAIASLLPLDSKTKSGTEKLIVSLAPGISYSDFQSLVTALSVIHTSILGAPPTLDSVGLGQTLPKRK